MVRRDAGIPEIGEWFPMVTVLCVVLGSRWLRLLGRTSSLALKESRLREVGVLGGWRGEGLLNSQEGWW